MNTKRTIFQKVYVPIILGYDFQSTLTLACAITDCQKIQLIGLVPVLDNSSLSAAVTDARRLRSQLKELGEINAISTHPQVYVSNILWKELKESISKGDPDLLILEWPIAFQALGIPVEEVLREAPCNIAILRGPIEHKPEAVLISLRGGPYAALALKLALSLQRTSNSKISSLHILAEHPSENQEAAYRGLARVLRNLPEINQQEVKTDDPARVILRASQDVDLLIIGATTKRGLGSPPLGTVSEQILRESHSGVVIVKTKGPVPTNLGSEIAGSTAISVLVDKWFAENTYLASEYSDLKLLVRQKEKQRVTISLALPSLNEEATVGNVIRILKAETMDKYPLLDEIVLIDSNSTDKTREIAEELGIPVFIHQELLLKYGSRPGKGEALWKSLYATKGDILLWIDTDITNIHPRFVYGLVGPLLYNPQVSFVKGYYRRPLRVGDKIQAGGGGRVTELTARPLINLFFPELSGIIQPLSGEYGGRRSTLEKLPFFSGYGVEIGLLIEVYEKFGLQAIAQIDLEERVHHNQSLEALGKMSFAIIQAVSRKLENRFNRNILEEVNKSMKLIRYASGRLYLDVEEIVEMERPAMIEIQEYQGRFSK